MIPGVLRGVIASSWLRASDQLRAPNAITTGQEIPQVEVVSREREAAEGWLELNLQATVSQNNGLRAAEAMMTISQKNNPLRLNAAVLVVVRKVA